MMSALFSEGMLFSQETDGVSAETGRLRMTERENPGARRLVLGFDAGCMTCNALARKIEEEVGDKLEVGPLHHPQVAHWREQALGTARIEPSPAVRETRVRPRGRTSRGWARPVKAPLGRRGARGDSGTGGCESPAPMRLERGDLLGLLPRTVPHADSGGVASATRTTEG